nr:hypothetical protein [Tanacetum cinerariifolium]
WLAIAGRATPTIMLRPRPAGARSKPNCCPAAARLSASKRPVWRSPTTSTPTSILTAATLLSATARPTNLNATA